MENNNFYTMKGYRLIDNNELTDAMEDYLEMILRLYEKNEKIRVTDLSAMLNVRPSSVSKMIQQLTIKKCIECQKYGVIKLTSKGETVGKYLLYRHNVINEFLCLVNNSDSELEQTEKIEHFLNPSTIKNIEEITRFYKKYISKEE